MADVLLLVDVQRNMMGPPEPLPAAARVDAVVRDLLTRARVAGAPVVHIRNNGGEGEPDETGTPGWELVHDVVGGEHVVDKHEPDSFAGTPLGGLVPPGATVVVTGAQSEYCVRATALSALRRGNRVLLPEGGHATYDSASPADEISAAVDRELVVAGAEVRPAAGIGFARPPAAG